MVFSIEHFIIGLLSSLAIVQQGFWMYTCFKLNDRLMSRDYNDFRSSERLKKPSNASRTSQKKEVIDPIAEKNALEANQLFTS